MAVLGAGMGFLMQITMLVAQNSVEMKDIGVGTLLATLFRTIGGSFGVSIFGALFTHQVQDTMRPAAAASAPIRLGQLDPATLAKFPPGQGRLLPRCRHGTHIAFLWGVVVGLVGFAARFFNEEPLRGPGHPGGRGHGDEQPMLVEAH